MSDDLVDRLRADQFMRPPPTKLQLEAADEIVRLRAALAVTDDDIEWAIKAFEEVKAAGPQKTRPLKEFIAELRAARAALLTQSTASQEAKDE